MDLNSPFLLLTAWMLVPLLALLASLGLGTWLELAAGRSLGPLVLPAGFLLGVVLVSLPLEVGVSGIAAVALCAVVALAGCVHVALRLRAQRPTTRWRDEWPMALAAGSFAYAVGMAPLAGSGRSGVLGYVLNNDPTIHLSVVELLHQRGAQPHGLRTSSFDYISTMFVSEYPIGSYGWPLFMRTVTGVDAFHLWTPLTALSLGLLAIVAFCVLRAPRAGAPLAAIGGGLVGIGYLPLSYLAQGGAKEVATSLGIYAAIALGTAAPVAAVGLRAFVPAVVAAGATMSIIGLASAAYLGPAAVALTALALAATPRARRKRILIGGGVAAAIAGLAALPAIASAIRFARTYGPDIANPAAFGNLVGPVPWHEAFNVWLAPDYRFSAPNHPTITNALIVLAALLGAVGLVAAWRRRAWAVPIGVVSAAIGTAVIASRYSIYFDAKAYQWLAPALGMASAAGVVWLIAARRREIRILGHGTGVLLAAGVAASALSVYSGVWVTPEERFEELTAIAERLDGEGPVLFHEREQYGFYFLRDSQPLEAWGAWQPQRGLRVAGPAPSLPKTPDFDDYEPAFVARYPVLVERRRPGGSLPPANYEVDFETRHYRIWRRTAPAPEIHHALGIDAASGTAALDCANPEAGDLLRRARREDVPVRAAFGRPETLFVPTTDWIVADRDRGNLEGFVAGRGGVSLVEPDLEDGTYEVYMQGAVGPGVRFYQGPTPIADVYGDLGLHDQWHRIGSVRVRGERDRKFLLMGLTRKWWLAGSARTDLLGTLAFVPTRGEPRIETVADRDLRRLCGRQLDWIELG